MLLDDAHREDQKCMGIQARWTKTVLESNVPQVRTGELIDVYKRQQMYIINE